MVTVKLLCTIMPRHTLECACCERKRSCLHKKMAAWHISQTWPSLCHVSLKEADAECDKVAVDMVQQEEDDSMYRNSSRTISAILAYMMQYKRLPPDVEPKEISCRIEALMPREKKCAMCPTHPQLTTLVVNRNAMLVDIHRSWHGKTSRIVLALM